LNQRLSIVGKKSHVGLNFYWGIVFTGIVMGLGSNPTHEVIRALQEFKKNLKIQNATAQ
jgi:hypothetical protein